MEDNKITKEQKTLIEIVNKRRRGEDLTEDDYAFIFNYSIKSGMKILSNIEYKKEV